MKQTLLSLLILLGLNQVSTAQQTWTVSNNTAFDANYDNLGDCIDAASAGDIILVDGTGASYGTDTIDKAVVIIGPGNLFGPPSNEETYEVVPSIFDNLYFVDGSAGAYISGIKITSKVYIQDNSVMIQRCLVGGELRLETADNISVNQSYIQSSFVMINSQNLICKNNIILGNMSASSTMSAIIENNVIRLIHSNVQNSHIKNNVILYADICSEAANPINEVNNNIFACTHSSLSANNQMGVDMSTVFVGYPTNTNNVEEDERYQLLENSPAIGYADDEGDCGAFGGDEPYVLSGLPPIPIIYDFNTPSGATENGGLEVEVKVRTNN